MSRPKVYAVDFDGTLCENRWPEIGAPNIPLIVFLKNEQAKGALVVLWTMREGRRLHEAREWLSNEFAFVPDAVNDNVRALKEQFGNNPRKVYADVYIDDHNAQLTPVLVNLPFTGENDD